MKYVNGGYKSLFLKFMLNVRPTFEFKLVVIVTIHLSVV